jgi:hypothetical protein
MNRLIIRPMRAEPKTIISEVSIWMLPIETPSIDEMLSKIPPLDSPNVALLCNPIKEHKLQV